jgi:hypothetical protein
MSYVIVGAGVRGGGSNGSGKCRLDAQRGRRATAASTTTVIAAGGDEVSAAIASLFPATARSFRRHDRLTPQAGEISRCPK